MLFLAMILLVVLALRGSRVAYALYVAVAIIYLPARAGFVLAPFTCETAVSVSSALFSLQNWKHIVLTSVVAMMTVAQFRGRSLRVGILAVVVTAALGLIAEVEQGAFGQGHCRMRDMAPNIAGAILGAGVLLLWRRRPGLGPDEGTGVGVRAAEQ